ncbi:cytochrome ubiquinol oxidase subunit I [Aquibacillus sp. 3ASR75-11]|uniref:Cytochrome ubiquinol oxidase subunit I n=1 Tax=Terrihalobacillus insolitus TaxID=2950438 RepID=A0A9X4AMR2_9BACI|nr:cytochrome ubiquinol oxidase subunit I [Terrihalobacillus insolitus]MDC3412765.1 cytochrome ubiquinol oxidase subunit I [Terrihalobacillus insolitus]MDC3423758.1 cytochrome ubiquinol oxidase subunit I [Terrihalobacillus insolitus]
MPELDSVVLSRMLTSLTLVFHIIFATIGVGVPLMVSIAEYIGIKKKDSHYILLARRWTRGFVITVAIGVVTGTAIGLQLSLLWPSFMQIAGNVISLPLFLETFAFFFEAIFLGAYLYTWDRFKKPIYHWLLSIPVVIGSGMSAVFITTVNAFMNAPQGFTLEGRTITTIDPIAAMLNPATPTKVAHVLTSSYFTSAAILAAIAAYSILRKKSNVYHRKALKLTVTLTLMFGILTAVAGDFSAKYLAENQPEKLAAAEWLFETEEGADLIMFGRLNESNEIVGGIRFPKLLSFLANGDFNSEVTGLDQFPESLTPPLWIHYMFDFMITIGMYGIGVSLLYILFMRLKKWNELNKPLLWLLVANGPLAMLGIEFGWIYAEVGRQPWILKGYMKVAEGATTSPNVGLMFLLFLALYTALGVTCVVVLRKMFRNNPVELELEHRYPNVTKKDDSKWTT